MKDWKNTKHWFICIGIGGLLALGFIGVVGSMWFIGDYILSQSGRFVLWTGLVILIILFTILVDVIKRN